MNQGISTICRYIQLPINLGMPEAWSESYQTVDGRTDGRATENVSLLRAAGRLGVGVFASGPLAEGKAMADQFAVVRSCVTSSLPPRSLPHYLIITSKFEEEANAMLRSYTTLLLFLILTRG
jgi:hypothetical protein